MSDTMPPLYGRREVRFSPFRDAGRPLAFPCGIDGRVDLDALDERARNDYFFARGLIGWRYAPPVVVDLPASQ